MKLAAACSVCFSALLAPALVYAAGAEPPPQPQLELGATLAGAGEWLRGRASASSLIAPEDIKAGFPLLLGGFSLGYRYQPVSCGAELTLGLPFRSGELGSVSGGGFVSLDLPSHFLLRLRLFEQSTSVRTKGPTPNLGEFTSHFSGVGGGFELGWAPVALQRGNAALQFYLGAEGTNLSRESDSSGSTPADARLVRVLGGLRVTADTRLGYREE